MARKTALKTTLGRKKYQDSTFHIVGKLEYANPKALAALIEGHGGKLVETIDLDLDILVVGRGAAEGPLSAEKKALALNEKKGTDIRIVNEAEFFQLFAPAVEEALALLRGGARGITQWNLLRRFPVPMPDLSGADLRKAKLDGACVEGVKFDGADLRGASLKEATLFLVNANLDGANLAGAHIEALTDCSVRDANLAGAFIIKADRADFSGSKMRGLDGEHLEAAEAKFAAADLTRARLYWANLPGADLSEARLEQANLGECDLSLAVLRGARLANADLSRTNLQKADLTGADLSDANLADADLSHSTVEGTDFSGANLLGVNWEGVDRTPARGLDRAVVVSHGTLGPALAELEKTAQKSERLQTTALVRLADHEATLAVTAYPGSVYANDSTGYWRPWNMGSLGQALLEMARRWSKGELQTASITLESSKGPLPNHSLKHLAVQAWCEAFGVTPPPVAAAKAPARRQRRGLPSGA